MPYSSWVNAIDPDKLNVCLQVLADVESLPPEHPDAVAVRLATAKVFKAVKKARRDAKREAVATADHAVTAATATGAPGRIDDETQGLPLVSAAVGATAGTLRRPTRVRAMIVFMIWAVPSPIWKPRTSRRRCSITPRS